MEATSSVDEILDFAIGREEEAARFYSDLAGRSARPAVRQVFEGLASEELEHKEKLEAIKEGGSLSLAADKVQHLNIAGYLEDVKVGPRMTYQDALTLAIKREEAELKMYSDLADAAEDDAVRTTLRALAQEEAGHKLRIEIAYHEHVQAQK